jgi:hypothetical protein
MQERVTALTCAGINVSFWPVAFTDQIAAHKGFIGLELAACLAVHLNDNSIEVVMETLAVLQTLCENYPLSRKMQCPCG